MHWLLGYNKETILNTDEFLGLVPEEPVLITLANGDIVESSPPQWGVDIKCGKGSFFFRISFVFLISNFNTYC